jgi:endogenous inhibitor of DNA gyrase (YacG/DUF329 family)
MGSTRYVQVACPVCGTTVRIMGEQSVPERCPDCQSPLRAEIRGSAAPAQPAPQGSSGPRSALVRLFAIRT